MTSMSNQNRPNMFPQGGTSSITQDDENRVMKKIKQSPLLPVATAGFLGLAAYRVYNARNRGGQKLSFYLIHTRLAAQGFAVAVLGSVVLYSLGERLYNKVTGRQSESEGHN